ncbi:CHAP domain-containing protein [Jeotgalicoccus aerolatus]|uniref:Surface antigen/LysM repeat protein n=3 Tax=Jeotgalicoccus aerolatus TaxID=709510 RepID=A0ABS4HJQ4_9STAP|nr:CHAP domain-containing protein [Jeotgalicoccus aerolatus]MBP1951153.1 surface antigen/LysM repeat protein [Jeotgalicoccus aerolatus]GGD99835.1 hypothetical protein GCM10007273_10250 [Jeotgalicoccus aerolatus]
MKKTVVSVATLTAITGVAATAVSADEYTISSGDTLWGIANEVGTSVADLKTDNKLSSDVIFPGDVLTVNPEEAEKDAEVEAAPAPANDEKSTYIVKPGDTLSEIGEALSLDYNEIMKLNNLSSDLIFAGQELTLDGSTIVAVEESAETPVVEEVEEAEEVEVVEEVAETESAEEPAVEEVQAAETAPAEEVEVAAPAVEEAETEVVEEVQEPSAEEIAAQEEAEAQAAAEAQAVEAAEAQAQAAAEQKAQEEAEAQAQAAAEQKAQEEAEAQAQAAAEQKAQEEAEAQAQAAAEQKAQEEAEAQAAAEQKAQEEAEAQAQAAAEQKAQEEAEAQAAAEQRAAEQRAAEQRAQEEAEAQAAAEEAEQAQPAAATPVSSASNGTNYYTWGSCAWYVFEKRSSMGMSVGNGWGDAKSWASNAQAAGYSVNNTPSVGSIMQAPAYTNGSYGQGHVAIVERVNGDGSILVSEMQFGGGLGDKSTRTISASNVSSHNFIH